VFLTPLILRGALGIHEINLPLQNLLVTVELVGVLEDPRLLSQHEILEENERPLEIPVGVAAPACAEVDEGVVTLDDGVLAEEPPCEVALVVFWCCFQVFHCGQQVLECWDVED